jgi:glyoxylase-like metal-dependent hydrolase (beta-lactamase superfamily II)
MFAVIEHPGYSPMLFDTGYSFRFFEKTRRWPNALYARLTPVTLRENDLAIHQLADRSIRPQDVERVFISHFHADHIAALADFTRAKYTYLPQAYDALRGKQGLAALRHAFIPELLPADFEDRSAAVNMTQIQKLPPEYYPFSHGVDVLGDQSIMAVELPGHAIGQMGLIIQTEDGIYFLVADACWLRDAYLTLRLPHQLANLLFSDPVAYRETVLKLNELHQHRPKIHIIPSHCAETITQYTQPSKALYDG